MTAAEQSADSGLTSPTELAVDLVILDLDGTILDLYRPTPISPAVRAAIRAVQDKGIPVTIATGRTLDYVMGHVADLALDLPVVTGQGAVIGDPRTGAVLEEITMSHSAARRAAAWIDAHPYVTALYFSNVNSALNHDERSSDRSGPGSSAATIRIYQNRVGSDPDFYDHVFGAVRRLTPSFAALVAETPAPPLKFIVAEDMPDEGENGLVQRLYAALGDELTITRTHPRLVEGTAMGVDKGAGVLRLCARLGVDPSRVLAIGDSDNDIPMLQAVGYGVAMGNASPGVKAVAWRHAPSIDQDGAAVALQRWVVGKSPD